jgi:putative peptide zinc metalloprotease protein
VRAAGVAPVQVAPGRHLAVALIPHGGATKDHPAIFVIKDHGAGQQPAILVSDKAPDTAGAPAFEGRGGAAAATPTASATPAASATPTAPAPAAAIPVILPDKPGPDDSQALAVNTKDGAIVYDVAYSLVTVEGGSPVDEENSAYALASCKACKTVAVSFQLVLVVGQSDKIMPINVAEALNYKCPYCITTAIAKQIVISLRSAPSDELIKRLTEELKKLDAIDALGDAASPADVLNMVDDVQQAIEKTLHDSGQLPPPKPTAAATPSATSSPGATASPDGSSSPDATSTPAPTGGGSTTTTPTPAPSSPSATPTPTPTPTPSETATPSPTPTATPSETPTAP